MKRRQVLALGIGLLVFAIGVGGGLVYLLQDPPGADGEHTFDGKPTSHWRSALRQELAEARKDQQPVQASLLHGGKDVLPVLIDLLGDEDLKVRRIAVQFITTQLAGRPGPEALPAVAPLTALLQDEDLLVRRRSVQALGYIGPSASDAVPAIARLLKDRDEWLAWDAAHALGNIGPNARAAVPALQEACNDPRKPVKIGARSALEKIDPTLAGPVE
ncbi:MAG: HEAT repeat domain-containing protein [Gemmataceae bacterium]|nr:HEAT repeat domain-containing protein [Gemmataceae bacterium]